MSIISKIIKKLLSLTGKTVQSCGTTNKQNRDNWLTKILREVPERARILDAGAGELRYKPLCAHLHYVSQDFGQYDGTGDKAGLQTGTWDNSKLDLVCDITDIPEPDNSFDAIMCVEVFEHLPEPVKAIAEFSRLLKPGGTLIITAPFCSLTHFGPYHFATGFSRYFYEKFLPEYGFDIDELIPNGNYFEYLAQEIRRIPSVGLDYAGTTAQPGKLHRIMQRLTQKILLKQLEDFSRGDSGSSELLCFGWHVKAVKE